MKKLFKAVSVIGAGIAAIEMIKQGNRNTEEIVRLSNENQELQNELREVKSEQWNQGWEQRRVRADVNYIERRRKLMEQDIKKEHDKVFKLELENIELMGDKKRRDKAFKEDTQAIITKVNTQLSLAE